MDDIRDSFYRMRKKLEHRLTGRKHKSGANSAGERAGPTSSLPQPEPHVVAGESYDREGDGANAAGERVVPTHRPPQPDESEPAPPHRNDTGQEGGEADVNGGEASQKDSHPDTEVVVGSEPSGELEGVYPSPSTPSISHGGNSDGT